MFGWIPLLSTLAQAADSRPVATLDTNAPVITIMPSFIPAGVAFRYHMPVGAAATVFVGFGIADQVLNIEVTNIRLEPAVGADLYLGERYRGLFIAPRLSLAYWTSSLVVGTDPVGEQEGGTNVKAGILFGTRSPVAHGGGTIGFAAGMLVHSYIDLRATGQSDGIQPLPQFELDLSLPNSRRSRDSNVRGLTGG